MYDWSYPRHVSIYFDFDSFLYLFFQQFEKQFPNVTSITIHTSKYFFQNTYQFDL